MIRIHDLRHQRRLLLLVLCLLLGAGAALAQVLTAPAFVRVQAIGQPRPRGIVYEPIFDRFAWVDALGRLLLVDARTLRTQHVLYESGSYTAYTFSHDGRSLALAIDVRVELWDTATGQRLAEFAPDGALATQGPLQFSEDDRLLLLNALNRAPRELRLSENDTLNLAWVWDLDDELGRARSTLPGGTFATNFFDYRYGLILGPNRTLVAGLPGRLQVLDLGTESVTVAADIEDPQRFERDPIDVWRSLGSDTLYLRPLVFANSPTYAELVAVQTTTRGTISVPLRQLGYGEISRRRELFETRLAGTIGQTHSREDVALLRLLLGDSYRASSGYAPLSVTLVDILEPITVVGETQLSLLVYVFDETRAVGTLQRIVPADVLDMALNPDGTRLAVRRASGRTPIEIYDLATGALERTLLPTAPYFGLLAYDATGQTLLSDFQRFDGVTGEVLFEDLTYTDGFQGVVWSADSQSITTTLSDGQQWAWALDGTTAYGAVLRRDAPDVRGRLLDSIPEEGRYLSEVFDGDQRGVEVYNAATGERRQVYFTPPPYNSTLIAQGASPDWEHFLVVYEAGTNTPHAPGLEIEVYQVGGGRRLYAAGDDLPEPPIGQVGWVDNRTFYFETDSTPRNEISDRVYGVEWDANGLPACLVETFPAAYNRWLDAWERANARLRGDVLARFALRLCERLPETAAEVDDLIRRPATATPVIVTAPPAVVAGVPTCLTRRYPQQSLAFAEDWRALTAGLSREEIADLEDLLCSGLGDIGATFARGVGTPAGGTQVMTIDIETQVRSVGGFIPPRLPNRSPFYGRSVDVGILDQFRAATGIFAEFASLSPDGRLMAILTATGHVEVYRLPEPHERLVETQTATYAGLSSAEPVVLRLEPTATIAFATLGAVRPTLTPTVTPTSPPAATLTVDHPQINQVVEACPVDTLYTLDAPPPDYAPPGRLLIQPQDDQPQILWVFDPVTGRSRPGDTVPQCDFHIACERSFDQEWILYEADEIILSRPDGSDARVVFTAQQRRNSSRNFRWSGLNTLEYTYRDYLPQESADEVSLVQRILPGQSPDPAPFRPNEREIQVNDLPTYILSEQPGDGPTVVVATNENAGVFGLARKVYMFNRDTGEYTYFARLTDGREITFEWHPLGDTLYYRYSDADALAWNVYDPASGEHRFLGEYPQGIWSRDGRYRVQWFTLPVEEQIARLVEDPRTATPTPRPDGIPAELFPVIRIWDRTTGLTRQYCVPGINNQPPENQRLLWSPDNRYLAFVTRLAPEVLYTDEFPPPAHLLLLDTHTGTVTDLGGEAPPIFAWIREPQGGQP